MAVPARRPLASALLGMAMMLAAGCNDPSPFPYNIVSLAVVPTEVIPFNRIAGYETGHHISVALRRRTTFRIVDVDSCNRIFSEPSGQLLFERFRTQANAMGRVAPELGAAMGERLGVGGVMYSQLSIGLRGQLSGNLVLNASVYDVVTGFRIWQAVRSRAFAGQPGEPAFNRVVGDLVVDMIDALPRPEGEKPE